MNSTKSRTVTSSMLIAAILIGAVFLAPPALSTYGWSIAGTLAIPGFPQPHYAAVIDQPNGYAYFSDGVTPAIVKINLATFTVTSSLSTAAVPRVAVIDQPNGFTYWGLADGSVIKVGTTTFTIFGVVAGILGTQACAGVIDQPNGFAYFQTPTSIVKVGLAPFAYVTYTANPASHYCGPDVQGAVIDQPNGYAYFGSSITGSEYVSRLDVNPAHPYHIVAQAVLVGSLYLFGGAVIDQANGFAYFGMASSGAGGGNAGKFDVNPAHAFHQIGSSISTCGSWNGGAVIDTGNSTAYWACWNGSGAGVGVARIDLSSFSYIDTLPFLAQWSYQFAAVIDVPNGYAYWGTVGPGSSLVIKVEIAPSTPPPTTTPPTTSSNSTALTCQPTIIVTVSIAYSTVKANSTTTTTKARCTVPITYVPVQTLEVYQLMSSGILSGAITALLFIIMIVMFLAIAAFAFTKRPVAILVGMIPGMIILLLVGSLDFWWIVAIFALLILIALTGQERGGGD